MNDQQRWIKWIKETPAWIKGAIGLATAIISFVILFRENVHLGTTASIGMLLATIFCLSIYIAFSKTPPLIEGGKGVYRFENHRRWAFIGIFLVPLLVIALFFIGASRTFVLTALLGSPPMTDEPLSQGLVVAVSDFAGDPNLGAEIADEIEEALLGKVEEARLEVTVLEGTIETQIDGPTKARQIAEQNSVDLIVWGKIIEYEDNEVKLIPRIFVAGPSNDLRLRGRNLAPIIIDPSNITLREETAINLAEFAALVFGVLNFNQGQYDAAIDILSSIGSSYEAEANFYLGLCYYLSGSYPSYVEAIDHIEKAVEQYPEFGVAYVNLGMIYIDFWRYDSGYENFAKARDIGRSTNDVELLAGANSGLGLYFFYTKDYDKAEDHFELSLDGYTELSDSDRTANQYGNLALVKLRKGQLEEAEVLLEEALKIHKATGDWLGEANDLNNLGTVFREQGDYSEALKYQNMALEVYEDHQYAEGMIRTLGNIGINYAYQKDYTSAESYFQRELKLAEEVKDYTRKVDVLNRLGQLQLLQKKPGNAQTYFQEALATYREIGSRAGEAETLYWLGITSEEIGEIETAQQLYNQVLSISREMADREREAEVLYRLGITYEKLGEIESAIQAYDQALTIFREIDNREMEQSVQDAIDRLSE